MSNSFWGLEYARRECVVSMKRFVERAVEQRSGVNARDEHGNTPLIGAASFGALQSIERLLELGALVDMANYGGHTALMEAATAHVNSEAMISRMVAAGCDIDAQNFEGETALMLAARLGRLSEVRCLLGAGASVALKTKGGCDAAVYASGKDNPCGPLIEAEAARELLARSVPPGAGGEAKRL
jgi:ankyrin repeat protein